MYVVIVIKDWKTDFIIIIVMKVKTMIRILGMSSLL